MTLKLIIIKDINPSLFYEISFYWTPTFFVKRGVFMNLKNLVVIQCLILVIPNLYGPKNRPSIEIDEIQVPQPQTGFRKSRPSIEIDEVQDGWPSLSERLTANKEQQGMINPMNSDNSDDQISKFERLRGLPSREISGEKAKSFDPASLKGLPTLAPKFKQVDGENTIKATNQTKRKTKKKIKKSKKLSDKSQQIKPIKVTEEIPSVERANADLKLAADEIANSISEVVMSVREDKKSSEGKVVGYGRAWLDQEMNDYNESRKIYSGHWDRDTISNEDLQTLKELGAKYLPGGAQDPLLQKLQNRTEVLKKAVDKENIEKQRSDMAMTGIGQGELYP